jgi:hypothetical protein
MSDGNSSFDPLASGAAISRRKCLLFAVPVLRADLAHLREVVVPPTPPSKWGDLSQHFPTLESAIGLIERSADDGASPEEEHQVRDTLQSCKEAAVMDQDFEIAVYFRELENILVRLPDNSGRPPHYIRVAREFSGGWLSGVIAVRLTPRNRDEQQAIVARRAACGEYLAEVFGPVPSVACSPEWRTDTVVSLARSMYESRDFSAMPILADALQDAGCENEVVLNHCRDTARTHVRGCWVVDLVLAKG